MPYRNEQEIVDFDAEAACEAVRDAVRGPLLSFTEFDRDEFNTLYAADATIEAYGDEETMLAHFERIHSYINLDFTEQELFTDSFFPDATGVDYLTTTLDFVKLVRVYRDDGGLYIAVAPDEPVVPIVEAIDEVCEATAEAD